MEHYKTRAELKQEAKDLLRGNWKPAILLNLIPTILIVLAIIFLVFISSFFVDFSSIFQGSHTNISQGSIQVRGTGPNGFGSGGYGIITGLFYIGITYTFLDWLRQPNRTIHPWQDATRVFRNGYLVPILVLEILVMIFTFLWSLLLVIPGIIKALAYSQTYFIYKDLRESGRADDIQWTQVITESRKLMDGHKWRYFVLQLSFIGWHILCALTLGIGYLWLNPYMNATLAAFYKDLSKDRFCEK